MWVRNTEGVQQNNIFHGIQDFEPSMIHKPIFTEILLTVTQIWKQPNCQMAHEWIKKW